MGVKRLPDRARPAGHARPASKAGLAAERLDELNHAAHRGEGRDLQYVDASSRLSTPSSRYLASRASSTARAWPSISGEDIALLDVLRPLAARQRLGVEGDVADQVEGVEIGPELLADGVERETLGRQLLDDGLPALAALPALEKVVEAGEALLQRRLGEIAQGLGDELAVRRRGIRSARQGCGRRRHRHRPSAAAAGSETGQSERSIDHRFVAASAGMPCSPKTRVGAGTSSGGVIGSLAGLVNLHRIAVEIRVGEMIWWPRGSPSG